MLVPPQRLLNAATPVFKEDFSEPLEQIAGRAGVTQRTLPHYFASQEEYIPCAC
jgi:AcrR family transcriptional regulator